MDFRLELTPKTFGSLINHQHSLLLMGSCFTENIGAKLTQHKFTVLENPNGILFNPISICHALKTYAANKKYSNTDLFYANECWNSWQHHSRFSKPDASECLAAINQSQQNAHEFLLQADWLFITLGSAFVYQKEDGAVVANCHKIHVDTFTKRLLEPDEIKNALQEMQQVLLQLNSKLKIIYTISPVRHLRDGLIENNRSKAVLIQAVHELVNESESFFYFPAYELVIDDLRDYRFYAEDMVHPNYAATNYVWDKFVGACIDEPTQKLMKSIREIHIAVNHKPFHPGSVQHQIFLNSYLQKVKALRESHPYIDFRKEENYFSGFNKV